MEQECTIVSYYTAVHFQAHPATFFEQTEITPLRLKQRIAICPIAMSPLRGYNDGRALECFAYASPPTHRHLLLEEPEK